MIYQEAFPQLVLTLTSFGYTEAQIAALLPIFLQKKSTSEARINPEGWISKLLPIETENRQELLSKAKQDLDHLATFMELVRFADPHFMALRFYEAMNKPLLENPVAEGAQWMLRNRGATLEQQREWLEAKIAQLLNWGIHQYATYIALARIAMDEELIQPQFYPSVFDFVNELLGKGQLSYLAPHFHLGEWALNLLERQSSALWAVNRLTHAVWNVAIQDLPDYEQFLKNYQLTDAKIITILINYERESVSIRQGSLFPEFLPR